MGSTPKLAIPYVEPADKVPTYPAAMKAQSERLEVLLTGRTSRTPGWVSAAAGWSITTSNIDIFTKLALWTFTASRTGAAITVPATGDIATTQVASFDPSTYPVLGQGPMSTTEGRLASIAVAASTGVISLTACAPGGNINTGENFSFSGLFFLN